MMQRQFPTSTPCSPPGGTPTQGVLRVLVCLLLFVWTSGLAADNDSLPSSADGWQYFPITATVHFACDSTSFALSYMDNARQMADISHQLDSIGACEIVSVKVRGSSSVDGSSHYNKRLSIARAASLKVYMVSHFPNLLTDRLTWDATYAYDDWTRLEQLLEQSDVQHRDEALHIIRHTPLVVYDATGKAVSGRKQKLKQLHGRAVWNEMNEKVFPYSRCAELQIIVKAPIAMPLKQEPVSPLSLLADTAMVAPDPTVAPAFPASSTDSLSALPTDTLSSLSADSLSAALSTASALRQPMLRVKTNLLLYGTYVPQCGVRPVPNIAVEYLPREGRWTAGASLDIPWYHDYAHQQFLQMRQWQAEGRRYFGRPAQYMGWFASAYMHTGVFGIGLNKQQGWQGEFVGGGVGGGYVMPLPLPLPHAERWRLEFSLQVGYLYAMHDPYVYGIPLSGEEDGRYYYNWTGDADLFRERCHRFSWLGPTRVGVTLSYDMFHHHPYTPDR